MDTEPTLDDEDPAVALPSGNAFLLAQLGAHAARTFAEAVSELDLTPAQVGVLRIIEVEPGHSQQVIAGRLGTPAHRLVAIIDRLEDRGLVERRRNRRDRRYYSLHLTEDGVEFLGRLQPVVAGHEDRICHALDADERARLHDFLARIAAEQDLAPGVHPGYRTLTPGAAFAASRRA